MINIPFNNWTLIEIKNRNLILKLKLFSNFDVKQMY